MLSLLQGAEIRVVLLSLLQWDSLRAPDHGAKPGTLTLKLV